MQPIQINVSVNIGLNQELYGLLSAVLNRPQVEAEAAAPAPKKPRAAKPQQVENKPEPVKEEKPQPEPQPEPETAAPVEAAPAPAAEAAKEYTEVDVRAAMDRTRKRIEGENYKEQTDSELYKKWHRRLTAYFKNTAAVFGAEKPSALPDSESRYKFIACCDAVYVKDDELVEDCPF